MKKTLLLFFFFVALTKLFAQKEGLLNIFTKPFKFDTLLISDQSQKLNLYSGNFRKFHSIELTNSEIDKKLELEPNRKTSIGLGFYYKWIGLNVSFSPSFINKDDDVYGKTKSFDMQLNVYSNSFGVDAYLQYYKGFYLKNPQSFINWSSDDFPLRPDLESYTFGLSAYYFTNNKKFSYKAAFTRTQIQKKSAGSFIVGAYLNRNNADVPNGLIPDELPDSLATFFNIEGYQTGSIGISAGYTYTLVLKRFFINASLVPGLGVRSAEFSANDITKKQGASITGSFSTRISLGYEGKRLYAGIRIISIADSYKYESIDISSSSGNVRLYIGKRFDVNNWFKNK